MQLSLFHIIMTAVVFFFTLAVCVVKVIKRSETEVTPTHGAVRPTSITLLERLRVALESNHFVLYYQPIYNIDKELVGAEALVRWVDNGNIVPPDEFMPLMESSMLLDDFTRWVITTAITDFTMEELNNLFVSINVPPSQLSTDSFYHKVNTIVETHNFDKKRLLIEVTESGYFTLDNSIPDVIGKFRGTDYRLALDDFGVGFSSLGRLRDYDFGELKIDKSFTMNLNEGTRDLSLIQGIMQICNSLGISVTLEGVETELHYNLAKSLGVKKIQGYYFSKPLALEDFLYYIKSNQVG